VDCASVERPKKESRANPKPENWKKNSDLNYEGGKEVRREGGWWKQSSEGLKKKKDHPEGGRKRKRISTGAS